MTGAFAASMLGLISKMTGMPVRSAMGSGNAGEKKVPNDKFWKWRVFVDTNTNLPMRTEWYRKTALDEKYTPISIHVISYPTDNEIEVVIQSVFK